MKIDFRYHTIHDPRSQHTFLVTVMNVVSITVTNKAIINICPKLMSSAFVWNKQCVDGLTKYSVIKILPTLVMHSV